MRALILSGRRSPKFKAPHTRMLRHPNAIRRIREPRRWIGPGMIGIRNGVQKAGNPGDPGTGRWGFLAAPYLSLYIIYIMRNPGVLAGGLIPEASRASHRPDSGFAVWWRAGWLILADRRCLRPARAELRWRSPACRVACSGWMSRALGPGSRFISSSQGLSGFGESALLRPCIFAVRHR